MRGRCIDANIVRAQVAALMAEFPELADDEEFCICTLESETDLFEALATVLDDIRAADALQQAIGAASAICGPVKSASHDAKRPPAS
jgi:hypothetical protein